MVGFRRQHHVNIDDYSNAKISFIFTSSRISWREYEKSFIVFYNVLTVIKEGAATL